MRYLAVNLWFIGILLLAQIDIQIPEIISTQNGIRQSQEQNDDERSSPIIEPYTQSDLTILTGNVQRPNGIAWFNNNLYTVCNGDWTLYELDDTNGDTRTYITGVRNGHDMYVDELTETEFDLWIPDYDANTLLRVNRTRAPIIIASGLEGPWGIASIDENVFLVTNLLGNNIVSITRDGDVTLLIDTLRSPTGLVAHDEFVYVANNGSSRRSIEWIAQDDLLNDNEPEMQSLVSGLQNTTQIIMAPDDMMYFAYALGTRGVVGRVDPQICRENGGCTNDEVEIVLYTELAAPIAGLTISPDMKLFVHTIFRPEIYWVQLETFDEQME